MCWSGWRSDLFVASWATHGDNVCHRSPRRKTRLLLRAHCRCTAPRRPIRFVHEAMQRLGLPEPDWVNPYGDSDASSMYCVVPRAGSQGAFSA